MTDEKHTFPGSRSVHLFLAAFFLGIAVTLLGGYALLKASGWDKTIRLASDTKSELQEGYRGVEEALGLEQGAIESVDDLIRVTQEERANVEAAQGAARQAGVIVGEIKEILAGSSDIIDRLIEWAESNDL